SAAWRSDGALAYTRGEQPVYRAETPYLRNVVVRATLTGPEERWTTKPDRFTVVAWAGSTWLVRRDVPGASPDLVAFDGSGRLRLTVVRARLAPRRGLVAGRGALRAAVHRRVDGRDLHLAGRAGRFDAALGAAALRPHRAQLHSLDTGSIE